MKYEHTGPPHRKLSYGEGGRGLGEGMGKNIGHDGWLTVGNFRITLA